jgi:hypothetical protein
MKNAKWMWFPGDFELYHSIRLHCRREEGDLRFPAFWKLDDCEHSVIFRKTLRLTAGETIEVRTTGIGFVEINGRKYPYGTLDLESGENTIRIASANPGGLAAVYVKGRCINSGEGWEADNYEDQWLPAAYSDVYTDISDNPEIFRFSYETVPPVEITKTDNGTVYDFGREIFAELRFEGLRHSVPMPVYYGESRAEAADTEWSYIRDTVPDGVKTYKMNSRAFRYIFIPGLENDGGPNDFSISAEYEHLPLQRRGNFRSSDEKLNRIWETAAYTFHLNCREFFLDGIKRDRWVWSGDAYQSYFINNYLFFDQDITRRTITALRGKDPVTKHINTILDYSFYWFMGIGDHYHKTGDKNFLELMWKKMVSLMDFCLGRCNADGFAIGLPGDWVFIDWAQIDKTGAVCAEQFLFVRALETMAECSAVLGKNENRYRSLAGELRKKIDQFFWREELHAYIDSYESGKNNVTRHANIFAILFGNVNNKRRDEIIRYVIQNEKIAQITTPYFKFYELETMCLSGNTEAVYKAILSYWGGMLDLGATTFWEEYSPDMNFPGHYAMYGHKYGKSLCHAWGASPVYLLGRYFLGVCHETDRFICAPSLGGLEWIEGTVPALHGEVNIFMDKQSARIHSSHEPGILLVDGESVTIPPGETIEIKL